MTYKKTVLSALLASLPLLVQADMVVDKGEAAPSLSQLLETSTMATPLKQAQPRYPVEAARAGKEGWVVLSYVVEPDGSVSNALVEDSSGQRSFERAAMSAVKKWRFEPATVNGDAIQQCNTSIRMDFVLPGKGQGASRKFVKRYNEITELVKAGKLDKAQAALVSLKSQPKWNLYEDAWYWMAMAQYQLEAGDEKGQLTSLTHAAGSGGKFLDEPLYAAVLKQMFVLQLKQNRYQAALDTYERLAAIDSGQQQANEWQGYRQQIELTLAGPDPLGVRGEIGDNDLWVHRLSRREFAFADVSGKLDKLDIRCDRKKHSFSFSQESAWKLPESWGSCSVYVHGEQNAEFTLVELADTPAAG